MPKPDEPPGQDKPKPGDLPIIDNTLPGAAQPANVYLSVEADQPTRLFVNIRDDNVEVEVGKLVQVGTSDFDPDEP